MHVIDVVPLLTALFYYAFYPVYSRILRGKLSSDAFWKVWFLAPLLTILAYSPTLVVFFVLLPLAIIVVYLLLKGRFDVAGLIEIALAGLETFLYLKG